MPDPLAWLSDALDDLDRLGLRRKLVAREGSQQGAHIEIAGEALVNFGSNDYLGLAADVAIKDAAARAIERAGFGAGASPLVTGRGAIHARLELELARFEETEAALLFPTGFAANVGAITALVGTGDAIFSDSKNHASIIDGCRLSGASVMVYRHRDADHLHELLSAMPRTVRRKLIVTDSLFSMDGDFAPLSQLAELASEFGAMLLVDEAHATGVLGARGRGLCEHLDVERGVHIRVGTLSKALGSAGGFVAGSQSLIDWLANRARPYVFSTAFPEATAAAALQALEIVSREPHRRQQLLARAGWLRDVLNSAGLSVGDSQSQIIPVIVGDPTRTMHAAAELRRRGLLVPGIRPPSVPDGESLLRISLSYLHEEDQLRQLQSALADVVQSPPPRSES